MEEIIVVIALVAVIAIVVGLIVWGSKKEKKQNENNSRFISECREKGISFENPQEAAEIMSKYSITPENARMIFAQERDAQNFEKTAAERDNLADNITGFAWLLGILGIIASVVILFTGDFILAFAGVLSSLLFLLMMLGLARIIDYLLRINNNTKRIADLLEKQNKQ